MAVDLKCPYCGGIVNAAMQIRGENSPPRAGDMGICIYCNEVGVVGEDLLPRKTTEQELIYIRGSKAIQDARAYMRQISKSMIGRA